VLSDLKRLHAVKPGRLNWLYDGLGLKLHTYKDGHRYCSSKDKELEDGNFYNRDGIFSIYKKVPLEGEGSRWIEFQYDRALTVHWQEGDESIYFYKWYQMEDLTTMIFLKTKLPLHMSSDFVSRYHIGIDGEACFSLLVPESYIEQEVPTKDPKELQEILFGQLAKGGSSRVCRVPALSHYKLNGYFSNACRYKQITKEKFNNSYFELMKAKGAEQYD
jgi:hypothetical protein